MGADNEEETQRAVKAHTMMAANMITDGLYGSSLMNDATLTNDMMALLQGEEAFKKYVDESYDSSADFWKLKFVDGKIKIEYDGKNDLVDENGNIIQHFSDESKARYEALEAAKRKLMWAEATVSHSMNPQGARQREQMLATVKAEVDTLQASYNAVNNRTDHSTNDINWSLEKLLTGGNPENWQGALRTDFSAATGIGRNKDNNYRYNRPLRIGEEIDMTEAALNATGWNKGGSDALTNRVNGLFAGGGDYLVARDLYRSLASKTQQAEAYREAVRRGDPITGPDSFEFKTDERTYRLNYLTENNPAFGNLIKQTSFPFTWDDSNDHSKGGSPRDNYRVHMFGCVANSIAAVAMGAVGRTEGNGFVLSQNSLISLFKEAANKDLLYYGYYNSDQGAPNGPGEYKAYVENPSGFADFVLDKLGFPGLSIAFQANSPVQGAIQIGTLIRQGRQSQNNGQAIITSEHTVLGNNEGIEIWDSSNLSLPNVHSRLPIWVYNRKYRK